MIELKKTCRNCKHFSDSYGFKNGFFVGLFSSCGYKKNIAESCRKSKPKFKLFQEKDRN